MLWEKSQAPREIEISHYGFVFHNINFLASHKADPYNSSHWLSCFTTPQHVSSTLLQKVD
ncbi:hypothetical protein PT2222_160052 [Paraburkholderia tropica]